MKDRKTLAALGLTLNVVTTLCLSGAVHASLDRYDYDPAGRLTRRVDDQAKSTDYRYDPSGNIEQVSAPTAIEPPVISSGPLGDIHRNEIRQLVIGGSGLTGVIVRTNHPGLAVSGVSVSATAVAFRLSVDGSVPLGGQTISVQNAAGKATQTINVVPAVAITVEPSPVSVPPDNLARKFNLRLSEPASIATTYTLSSLSPNIAKPKTTSVPFAAGQSQAEIGVTGLAQGTSTLRVNSNVLTTPYDTLVFVAPGAADRLVSMPSIGIIRALPWAVAPSMMTGGSIGIVRGPPADFATPALAAAASIGLVRGVGNGSGNSSVLQSATIDVVRGMSSLALSQAGITGRTSVGVVRDLPSAFPPLSGIIAGANIGINRN